MPITAGDVAAPHTTLYTSRCVLKFADGSAEYAAVSQPFVMPSNYAEGTLKATLHHCSAVGDNTKNVDIEVYVEAITPDVDPLDLNLQHNFDDGNQATIPCLANAYDLQDTGITLSNDCEVVAGDLVRILIRRDSDDAADTAAGDFYLFGIELEET